MTPAEYSKRYREKHPERVAAASRARYEANRDAILEQQRARQRRDAVLHPERAKEYQRRQRHGRASNQARRRARLRGAIVEKVDRLVVYERDGGICGLCGVPVPIEAFHLDHIIPLAKGGEHSYANTQVAHPRCNISKRDRERPYVRAA